MITNDLKSKPKSKTVYWVNIYLNVLSNEWGLFTTRLFDTKEEAERFANERGQTSFFSMEIDVGEIEKMYFRTHNIDLLEMPLTRREE